eukprot:TRINITY_DN4110_c0_g1_i1.p1 TRINITY_DN4110_c0_g1~~TRINITY_DN4110_c0_g1_i1.p1  ORF type:complete len:110 (+),score=27.35 TRINITY_DN4110_c0_g1_i1:98-427(+)
MARSNGSLLTVALLGAICLLAANWAASPAFVPPAANSVDHLRGSAALATAGAVATGAAPLAAQAVDEYLPYRMNGEWQIDLVIEYFLMTSAMTLFAFGCYFVLVKLKII